MLYTPLLPGAAGATLDPRHVVVPLRSQLRHTDLADRPGEQQVTLMQRTLGVSRLDGEQVELAYDQLIVALGSVSRTLPIPGLAEHAIGFKSLSDATALRNRVLSCMDIAESLEDPARRAEYLGFVFVGAGYAGVEGLAELQDFAAQAIELYPRCRAQGMRWVLVETKERIMQEVPESLSEFADARAARTRHRDLAPTRRSKRSPSATRRSRDGEPIPARTVVWTAGVKPSPAVAQARAAARTRTVACRSIARCVSPAMSTYGRSATVPRCPIPRRPGQPCPPTAQHAIRQGRLVASNVAATLGNGRVRPFSYRTKGVVAELGDTEAVALTLRHPLAGSAGLVDRPDLSPAVDARHRAQAAPADRLERRAAVRPRHLLAGSPGRPDAARRPDDRRSDRRILIEAMAILDADRSRPAGAMRAGEKERVGALRLVLSELQKAAKEGSDDELAVLRRERKRRLEAAQAYPRRRPRGRPPAARSPRRADRRLSARRSSPRTELQAIVAAGRARQRRGVGEGHGPRDGQGDGGGRRSRRRQAGIGARARGPAADEDADRALQRSRRRAGGQPGRRPARAGGASGAAVCSCAET